MRACIFCVSLGGNGASVEVNSGIEEVDCRGGENDVTVLFVKAVDKIV